MEVVNEDGLALFQSTPVIADRRTLLLGIKAAVETEVSIHARHC